MGNRIADLEEEINAHFERLADHRASINSTVARIEEGFSECLVQAETSVKESVAEFKHQLSLEGQIEERPLVLLMTAVGIGLLAGKWAAAHMTGQRQLPIKQSLTTLAMTQGKKFAEHVMPGIAANFAKQNGHALEGDISPEPSMAGTILRTTLAGIGVQGLTALARAYAPAVSPLVGPALARTRFGQHVK